MGRGGSDDESEGDLCVAVQFCSMLGSVANAPASSRTLWGERERSDRESSSSFVQRRCSFLGRVDSEAEL